MKTAPIPAPTPVLTPGSLESNFSLEDAIRRYFEKRQFPTIYGMLADEDRSDEDKTIIVNTLIACLIEAEGSLTFYTDGVGATLTEKYTIPPDSQGIRKSFLSDIADKVLMYGNWEQRDVTNVFGGWFNPMSGALKLFRDLYVTHLEKRAEKLTVRKEGKDFLVYLHLVLNDSGGNVHFSKLFTALSIQRNSYSNSTETKTISRLKAIVDKINKLPVELIESEKEIIKSYLDDVDCDYNMTTTIFSRESVIYEREGRMVSLAKDSKENKVAIKTFKGLDDFNMIFSLVKEIHMLSNLKHDNVIKLLGWRTNSLGHYEMVIEAMQYSLKDHAWNGVLSDYEIKNIALQAAEGFRYLHDHHIVHRDIKADNLLISYNNIVKVTDLGQSYIMTDDDFVLCNDIATTYEWAPPEHFSGFLLGKELMYDRVTDIYSFAITVSELILRRYPGLFTIKINDEDMAKGISREMKIDEQWDECHQKDRDAIMRLKSPFLPFLDQCWNKDPDYRLGAMAQVISLLSQIDAPAPQGPQSSRSSNPT